MYNEGASMPFFLTIIFSAVFLVAMPLTAQATPSYAAELPKTVLIEKPNFTASVSVVMPTRLELFWAKAEIPIVGGLFLFCFALAACVYQQHKSIKHYNKISRLSQGNNLSDLIKNLCHTSSLERLNAIQGLSSLADGSLAVHQRLILILTAYLRALLSDAGIRGTAGDEINLILHEIIDLRKIHPESIALDFSQMDFSALTLNNIDFKKTILIGANFNGAALRHIDFTAATLDRASFIGTKAQHCIFKDTSLRGTVWKLAEITECDGLTQTEIETAQKLSVVVIRKAQPIEQSPETVALHKQQLFNSFAHELTAPQDKTKLH